MDITKDDAFFDLEDILKFDLPEEEKQKRIESVLDKIDSLRYDIQNQGMDYISSVYIDNPVASIRYPKNMRTIATLYADSSIGKREAIESTEKLRGLYTELIDDNT